MPKRTSVTATVAMALFLPLAVAQAATAAPPTSSATIPFNAITYVSDGNSSGYDLWTMGADGSKQTMLTKSQSSTSKTTTTNTPSVEWAPVYSPDHSLIAFESRRASGNADVWVQNTTTYAITRVTTNAAAEAPGGWYTATDGPRIVYSRGDGTLWSVRPDGNGNVQISDAVSGLSRVTMRNDGELAASVSVAGVNRIYTFAVDRTTPGIVPFARWTAVTNPAPGVENDFTPAWNPATGALVFNREGDDAPGTTAETGELLSLPSGVTETDTPATIVLRMETRAINPAYSSDGTHLAFAVSNNATGTTGYEIAIASVNSDGTASVPKIVTSTSGLVSQPTWKI
jgi:Tol biopolymer transport system component